MKQRWRDPWSKRPEATFIYDFIITIIDRSNVEITNVYTTCIRCAISATLQCYLFYSLKITNHSVLDDSKNASKLQRLVSSIQCKAHSVTDKIDGTAYWMKQVYSNVLVEPRFENCLRFAAFFEVYSFNPQN